MKPSADKKSLEQEQQDEIDAAFRPAKIKGRFSSAIRIALTFVIISLIALIILVVYIKTSLSAIEAAHIAPLISGQISGSFQLLSKGVLQYNNSRAIVEYAKVHYDLYNSANTLAVMTVYASNPVRRIYLLNVEDYCVDCFIGSSLYTQPQLLAKAVRPHIQHVKPQLRRHKQDRLRPQGIHNYNSIRPHTKHTPSKRHLHKPVPQVLKLNNTYAARPGRCHTLCRKELLKVCHLQRPDGPDATTDDR